MDYEYTYIKPRSEFGSACYFAPDSAKLVCSFLPDKSLSENYIVKNPVNRGIQDQYPFSAHEVNTHIVDFADHGMNHDQGGWPKDLNILDEEAVLRYRKKLEREDNYIASLSKLTKTLEHAVLQNNAVNIYEIYYEDIAKEHSSSETLSRIRNEFTDIGSETGRPVSHLSWFPFDDSRFAVCYCNTEFQIGSTGSTEAYIWNTEIPNAPMETFNSNIPIVNLEWNTSDHNLLAGGMITGDITLYDVRRSPGHVAITPDVMRHRDPVHSILWMNSKTGSDFFSTSSDGVIKWWDCRNLKRTTDSLILDLGKTQNRTQARCPSCLEFDPSIPARFMVGTEDGCVIAGNRKGTNLAEKLPWSMKTHFGPVYSLQRNQAFSKNFLTVGDWRARIWTEECRESAIMWTKAYKVPLVAGEWSKGRPSVFIVARADGYADLWDLLQDQISPTVSITVSEYPLTTLRYEGEGRFAVIGDSRGKTKLVQFGNSLCRSDKNDKANLSSMFDRETRREKILETRLKEIKLALKTKMEQEKTEEMKPPQIKIEEEEEEEEEENENIVKAEEDYWEAVNATKAAYTKAAVKKEVQETVQEEVKERKVVEEEQEATVAAEPLETVKEEPEVVVKKEVEPPAEG